MDPMISIIVPVYKVEPYIHKCIDSILSQTFIDFELILVDDGSPDNCCRICDEYVDKDPRIKVIHKENGGQASARNAGLDAARGRYIGFVDSDDYIEQGMYELLFSICENHNCDIAVCTSTIHYKDKIITRSNHPLTILDNKQAMKTMLEGVLFDEVVWTKLFKHDLLQNCRFETGIIYEDTAFTYKVLYGCKKVCCIGAPLYNYVKRENSTMDRAVKDLRIDAVVIYDDMYKFIKEYYPELSGLVALKLANSAMAVLNLMSSVDKFSKHKEEYYRVANILNSHFIESIRQKTYPRNVKLLLLATKIHPLLYKQFINFVSKVHQK